MGSCKREAAIVGHEPPCSRTSPHLYETSIIAIAHERDKHKLGDALLQNGADISRSSGSTGGFLRQGNVTVLIGVEDDDVDRVMGIH